MPSKVLSVELHGLEGFLVEIEADRFGGLPSFSVVGLPDAAIQEARERTRSAIVNSGFEFPRSKIVVSLAPGDLKKVGARFDLPIAISLLAMMDEVDSSGLSEILFLGELALNGDLRPLKGILASVEAAQKMGFKRIVVPAENAREATLIPNINILPARNLIEAIKYYERGLCPLPIPKIKKMDQEPSEVDLSMVRGQIQAKRALEIAAAGGHNLLFCGSPGSGKTLMAKALRGVLPSMTFDEQLEVTKIYSVAGLLPKEKPLVSCRPFRTIHHTASAVSIVGGGNIPGPGEVSLAHRGVLFLDEIAEFPRSVLETLRQPMEDRRVTVTRIRGSCTYPSHFLLVGAMNPCPCGYRFAEDDRHPCSCSPMDLKRYEKRLSGPLLDRIDLFVNVKPVQISEFSVGSKAESSAQTRKKIERAVMIQRDRFSNSPIHCNAEMGNREVEKYCRLESKAKSLLHSAADQMGLSARAYFRVLKVSRTIADLENRKMIGAGDVSESIHYKISILKN